MLLGVLMSVAQCCRVLMSMDQCCRLCIGEWLTVAGCVLTSMNQCCRICVGECDSVLHYVC